MLERVVILSENLTLGKGVFIGCENLNTVYFLGKQLHIEDNFIHQTNITEIKVHKGVFERDTNTQIDGIQFKEIEMIEGSCGSLCHYIIESESPEKMTIYGSRMIDNFNKLQTQTKNTITKQVLSL